MASNRSLKPAIKKLLAASGYEAEFVKLSKAEIEASLPGEDIDAWDPMVAFYVKHCLQPYDLEGLLRSIYPESMVRGETYKKRLKFARKFRFLPIAKGSDYEVVVDLDTGGVSQIVEHSFNSANPMHGGPESEHEHLLGYFQYELEVLAGPPQVDVTELRTHAQLRKQKEGVRLGIAKDAVKANDIPLLRAVMESGLLEDCSPGQKFGQIDLLSELGTESLICLFFLTNQT